MKYHACHVNWISDEPMAFLIGFISGRVSYEPHAKWLYSLRIFFGIAKFELLWTTK